MSVKRTDRQTDRHGWWTTDHTDSQPDILTDREQSLINILPLFFLRDARRRQNKRIKNKTPKKMDWPECLIFNYNSWTFLRKKNLNGGERRRHNKPGRGHHVQGSPATRERSVQSEEQRQGTAAGTSVLLKVTPFLSVTCTKFLIWSSSGARLG